MGRRAGPGRTRTTRRACGHRCAHDLHVGGAELGEVVLEALGPGMRELAGRDAGGPLASPARGEGAHLACLAAGRGAHVEDVRAWTRCQHKWRQHGRETLQVEIALLVGVEVPDAALAHTVGEHEGVGVPGHAVPGDVGVVQRDGNLLARRAQGVRAQRHRPRGRPALRDAREALLAVGGAHAGHEVSRKPELTVELLGLLGRGRPSAARALVPASTTLAAPAPIPAWVPRHVASRLVESLD